ncbi:hypothetical protein [Arcobacter cloacae]|uniref:Uncharacterized protein n=1 Tax=Arcobacter cloacae TaxID=1054034 RepID=A0A6M8NL78_9BACT|nr:hypothetical protein [Arcobacter cloacae]QKF89282.1 putative membrane protein [Arcobacter cloacae]RXI39006.1 hypothetical protein CP963_10710 [Arcobacter cloacae]
MFNQGLSLTQAPPISVPFRFFLSAPIFGVLISLIFLVFPLDEVSNEYHNVSIGLIHLFTLGILTMIIFGAMQQMMPVLAGAVVSKPKLFANIVHSSLFIGTICMSFSFILDMKQLLYIGVLFLSLSFLSFFIVCIKLLFEVKFLTSTVKAMRLFSLSGLITFILGFYLAFSHIDSNIGENYLVFVNTHILFGLLGFAFLLIMGVSFQVIPMFYVALDFPKFVQHKVPIVLFITLFISFFSFYFEINFLFLKFIFVVMILSFAYFALKSLNNRKRPVFDVTLWYWKFSLICLVISMIIWLFDIFESNYILAICFAFGFLYSLLQGMVYKIIPFLSWFHLNSKGYFSIPTIREFIDERWIKLHFSLHFFSIIFFLISYFEKEFIYIAAILFLVSNILFFINALGAIKKYLKIIKTNPMDLSSFK